MKKKAWKKLAKERLDKIEILRHDMTDVDDGRHRAISERDEAIVHLQNLIAALPDHPLVKGSAAQVWLMEIKIRNAAYKAEDKAVTFGCGTMP